MIAVMGTVRLAAGEIDRLSLALTAMMAATQAEDGCIHYVYARDITDPNHMTVSELWRDEAALKDWATPMAGLNLQPTHMSPEAYYAQRVENLKSYPVYYPSREPAGYWEMLQKVGPKPLIEPERLKTEADWIEAGSG